VYCRRAIELTVSLNLDQLFEPYARGRPAGWSVDSRTRDLVCLGNWLDVELKVLGADDQDRCIVMWNYNRLSRAQEDLLGLAVQLINDYLSGHVDRKPPHRRWG